MRDANARRPSSGRAACAALAGALALALGAGACARRPDADETSGAARLMRNLHFAREVAVVADTVAIQDECLRIAARRAAPDRRVAAELDRAAGSGSARDPGGDSASGDAAVSRDARDISAPRDAFAPRAPSARRDATDPWILRVVPPERAIPRGAARIVVGTHRTLAALDLLPRLSIKTGEEEGRPWFSFDEQRFDLPADALIATFEDPERPGLPVTLFFGNDERFLVRYLGELDPGWKPHLALYRSGALVVSAPLRLSGELVPNRVELLGRRRSDALAAMVGVASDAPGLTIRADPTVPEGDRAAAVGAAVRAREAIRAWAAPEAPPPELDLTLYGDLEGFARQHGARRPGHVGRVDFGVHVLVGAGTSDDGGRSAAEASARLLLGEPVEAWMLDAAALDAARGLLGTSLDRTIAWIAAAGLALPVAELVDARADERHSALLLGPQRAALLRHLLETRGPGFVRQAWRGTARLVADGELAEGFARALEERAARQAQDFAAYRLQRVQSALERPMHGIVLEAVTLPAAQGYGSHASAEAIDRARELGADAVELLAWVVDEPDPPAIGGLEKVRGPECTGGDLRLSAAIAQARQRQCRVLVDFHLVASPAGTWSGGWPRRGDEAWERFFERYRRGLVHVALLAELGRADVLSIGAALPSVTRLALEGRRALEDEIASKEVGWERVLRATRGAFGGALTYAAASEQELGTIGFWGRLDAIGFSVRERLRVEHAAGIPPAVHELETRIAGALGAVAREAASRSKPWLLVASGVEPRPEAPGLARIGPGARDPRLAEAALGALEQMLRARADDAGFRGLFLMRWTTDPAFEAASASPLGSDVSLRPAIARVFASF